VGPQSQSVRGGEVKNSQPLSGFEPYIIQPVAQRYTTELSRLISGPATSITKSVHVITNDVSNYIILLIRITHIICNHILHDQSPRV
jgi:hypothetical protein